ncbi:DUF7344 domain-containing protein [Haladaptatus halobius]|uniref:DUF7344 domain-containing protein n=1 Tax=Haladaptatus halobius TaxID=2884875 RepID=UPI001D0A788D|nr:hypothetical protein [Haladaptatus halobius]
MTTTQGDTYLFDALNENISSGLPDATIREFLEDRQCRAILQYLEAHDGPVNIAAMIDHLTFQEIDIHPSETAATLSEHIAAAVWTVHLPALAAHDIVRYDRQSRMVRWWRNAGRLTQYLRDPPK